MGIHLNILKSGKRLAPYEAIIQGAFDEVIQRILKLIQLPDIDIVIADAPRGAIPETGVGGQAYTKNLVFISINPEFQNLKDSLANEVKSTLAHELHHCARMNTVGYGKNLLETLITEGLADHFDIEVNGGLPRPWSIAVQGEALERMNRLAASEYYNESYNHFAWFFGAKDLGIPRWTGYSLGFDLVGEHISRTGKKASELVSIGASVFV